MTAGVPPFFLFADLTLDDIQNFLNSIFKFKIFEINQTPVTVMSFVLFALVFICFLMISKMVRHWLLERTIKRFKVDEGTGYTLQRMVHYLVMIIGALVAFQFIGIDISSLVVVFSLLSVGIGFGLQNITSNFISGLILLFERPIKVGDRITVGDVEGDVLEINIRSTTIRSLNNISIIVPNSEFVSSSVINWSHRDPKIRVDIKVGVSYSSDLDTVLRCLDEVGKEEPEALQQPEPEVLHRGFGDSAWDMELRVWIADPKRHHQIASKIHKAMVHKFREHGVEIPFPQRDLHVRTGNMAAGEGNHPS